MGQRSHRLEGEIGALLVTEEALAGPDLEPLLAWCASQPPWSDLPVIVLATRQAGTARRCASRLLERLGNVVLLERPINAETLLSAAAASLRARAPPVPGAALLAEQQRDGRAAQLNETLERRVEERTRELDTRPRDAAFALESAGMGSWDLDLVTGTPARSPRARPPLRLRAPQPAWARATFLRHVLDEDRAAAERPSPRRRSGTLDLECRIRRADGAMRWIAARARSATTRDGEPLRMAGVVMDTTERRLTEDALHQAQKMEAIGQLTGGVAHDFNNLLTVIVGGLDMVMRRPEHTERVVRLAEAAMAAARRGEQLTQQLLAFSRRQMLRPQTLDTNRLLLEFEALAQRAVGEPISLGFDLEPAARPDPRRSGAVRIGGAEPRRQRARRHAGRRHDHRASARAVDQAAPTRPGSGHYVAVAVSDTGEGIDAGP